MPENPLAPLLHREREVNRELRIEVERLKLENTDLKARVGKPDPQLGRQAAELARLRAELQAARDERDQLLAGVRAALEQLRRG